MTDITVDQVREIGNPEALELLEIMETYQARLPNLEADANIKVHEQIAPLKQALQTALTTLEEWKKHSSDDATGDLSTAIFVKSFGIVTLLTRLSLFENRIMTDGMRAHVSQSILDLTERMGSMQESMSPMGPTILGFAPSSHPVTSLEDVLESFRNNTEAEPDFMAFVTDGETGLLQGKIAEATKRIRKFLEQYLPLELIIQGQDAKLTEAMSRMLEEISLRNPLDDEEE